MRVVPVDPTDDWAFDAWFAAFDAGHLARWPDEPGWQPEEQRALALHRVGLVRTILLAATDGGSVIGAASVEIPLADNRHLAEVTVEVPPTHRRRGVGGALLASAEATARDEGRSVVVVTQKERGGLPDSGPGRPFAIRHGYSPVLEGIRRDLTVPVDGRRLDALEAAATPHYRVVTFRDRWPEEYLSDRATFGLRMSTDVPLGQYDRTEECWDADRVRQTEALVAAMGRILLVAVAVEEASGRPVAFSEITVPLGVPQRAYQWDTLVLEEHRGHRLGTLVKVANLRQLVAASPATTTVTTWNARQNDPMIAVNEALGCTVMGTCCTWQKRLGPPA